MVEFSFKNCIPNPSNKATSIKTSDPLHLEYIHGYEIQSEVTPMTKLLYKNTREPHIVQSHTNLHSFSTRYA